MSLPDAARPAAMALRDQSAVRPLPPISTSTGHTQAHRREKGGLKVPIIQQLDNSVLVTLRHEKLGTPEEIIVEYLKRHDEINNSTARKLCFIGSENSIKRIFQKMIAAGLIERVAGRPLNKTGYVKGPKFPQN